MSIAIVTDTTAYIPNNLLERYDIYTIPLSVVFGEEAYREDKDITTEEFYEKVRTSKELPSTTQPPIGMFVELFEKLSENYDAVISIHLSKQISGTFDSAIAAGKMVEGIEVYPFDSTFSCMAQGFYAMVASEMAQEGKSSDAILSHLHDMREKSDAYFIVDDLSHLQRGGRLTSAQAIVGSLLDIKPVLHMPGGQIKPFEKIRTRKKAIKRIMSMIDDEVAENTIERVAFIHANNEESALQLQKEFQQRHPNIESVISYFGPVIGTHLGEGALGATWYTK